jgi:nucleoid-associated protein YgaU
VDLKSSLKTIKLNEPLISAVFGAIVLLIIGFVLFNYLKTKTQTGTINSGISTENTDSEKSGTSSSKYTVQKGDHLWKIAENHYQSGYKWVDIAKANNLKNPSILIAGQELVMPELVKENEVVAQNNIDPPVAPEHPTPPTAPSAPTTTSENSTTPGQQVINADTYMTVQGDSLWKIAVRAYGDGYRWPEIAKLNNLKNPNIIFVNQTLKLPPK